MSSRPIRSLVAAFGATAVLVTAGLVPQAAVTAKGTATKVQTHSFQQYLESTGAARRGDGAAQEQYENRAYPRSSITVDRTLAAARAFQTVQRQTAEVAGGSQWQELGPVTPQVPGYVAGGRATTQSGRVDDLAISPKCVPGDCMLWVATAGGGVWRTKDALASPPSWQDGTSGLDSLAVGSIYLDPTDPRHRTLYAGTGEPNGSGDSEAGLGLFKSTDAGLNWSLVPGSFAVAKNRSIASIAVDPTDPMHILIGTDLARHGSASVNGGRRTPPDAPTLGLYESKDGGASFSLLFSKDPNPTPPATGFDWFQGGVNQVGFDPNDSTAIYAAIFGYGVFRSAPAIEHDAAFHKIFATVNPDDTFGDRTQFAFADRGSSTRIYLGDSSDDLLVSELWRLDDASVKAATLTDGTANPGWTYLSNPMNGTVGFASYGFCGQQCGYDLLIGSPSGHPDNVWIGGQTFYGEYGGRSNGRAVQRSTDAGMNFADMTADDGSVPLTIHPDNRAVVFASSNPDIAFIGSDGGVVRTGGTFSDRSNECADRGLQGANLRDCQRWLKVVPSKIYSLNDGLPTIQFQSLSVNPNDPFGDVMGGTQDNGTWSYSGSPTWFETIGGDGGQSGYNIGDPNTRMHTYYAASPEVNFSGSDIHTWDWIGDRLYGREPQSFYIPLIADPATAGTWFAGLAHVWRTTDNGGDPAVLDAHCNSYHIDGTVTCGDWQKLGGAGGDLTSDAYGDRAGQYVVATARSSTDPGTLWAATRIGRVFITHNANAARPGAVQYTRIDTPSTPGRFVSGIAVDPNDPNHAFVSYSGYSAYTPGQEGHVFEVRFDPVAGTATWKDRSYDLGDMPVTGLARDDVTYDLYASTDFGVLRLPYGRTHWVVAAQGMPKVTVFGLTIDSTARVLYAATHGRGAWRLFLPNAAG